MIMAACDFSGDRVAAVVIEPIQGEGGINVAPPGYLAAARALCDQYGAMLVFDEIQCGMGRSGKMFCCEHDGVAPDLMALARGRGLMLGMEFTNNDLGYQIAQNLFARQILISGTYI